MSKHLSTYLQIIVSNLYYKNHYVPQIYQVLCIYVLSKDIANIYIFKCTRILCV